MVTATAATNGKRQRPATAHNTHTIRGNLGYVRPEKRTVQDQRRSAATAANTAAKPLDNARAGLTAMECQSSARSATDDSERPAHSCGSEGRPWPHRDR
jgi:hypothetical protein